MIPALQALVALQQLDTAADAARKRQAELPAAEDAIAVSLAAATHAVDTAKANLAENHTKRLALEKDVAGVDSRMARFNEHKMAVKTNHEYTAVLHEIETAKAEKDVVEERILVLMEEADALTARVKAAKAALDAAQKDADKTRAAMAAENAVLDEELARLAGARTGEVAGVDAALLARYEQLLKNRRGIAVAAMTGEMCSACFVRLRPHVTQQIRRNDEIRECESCQRILYYEPLADGA